MLLKFLKKYTRKKVDNNFDKIYDSVKELAEKEHNYKGDIKIISDTKFVKFYMINEEV
jgi:hypothetical protein